MKTIGKLTDIKIPFRCKFPVISFEVKAEAEDIEKYFDRELDIEFKQHRNRRSLDANALLWACLGEIAKALKSDSWSVYLYMLQRYGKYTYILVKPEAVEGVKAVWRETKVVGETKRGGEHMIEMLCYFGSSTYDSKEFSILLNGVIAEMREMHLETPPSDEMKRLIEEMERKENDKSIRQS